MNHTFVTRIRVDGEHDAGTALVGPCHLHHDNGDGAVEWMHVMLEVIANRTLREHACNASAPFLDDVLFTAHVEVRFVLACKRRIGRILGCGGGPHGNVNTGGVHFAKFAVLRCDSRLDAFRNRCLPDQRTSKGSTAVEVEVVGGVCVPQAHFEGVPEGRRFNGSAAKSVHLLWRPDVLPRRFGDVGGDEPLKRLGGQREPVGDLDADGGQFLKHLAQRCTLSTDRGGVVHVGLVEPLGEGSVLHGGQPAMVLISARFLQGRNVGFRRSFRRVEASLAKGSQLCLKGRGAVVHRLSGRVFRIKAAQKHVAIPHHDAAVLATDGSALGGSVHGSNP